jgi:hypothetical protein
MQEVSERLDIRCTNNQSDYEALIAGLMYVIGMGVKMWKCLAIPSWLCIKYVERVNVWMVR